MSLCDAVLSKQCNYMKVKSLGCVRLWDPMDCNLPGSSVHGIFQARVLEWGAISKTFGKNSAHSNSVKEEKNKNKTKNSTGGSDGKELAYNSEDVGFTSG